MDRWSRKLMNFIMTITLLPDAMICEILIRLSVEDLARFRCVSKFFRSLIDRPSFIRLHVSHSQKTNTNLYGMFEFEGRDSQTRILDIANSANNLSLLTVKRSPLEKSRVQGSCNGLVALNQVGTVNLTFWNPLTGKQSKRITSNISLGTSLACGFGYDPKNDEYKFVSIADCYPITRTWVYSLKTNSWKEISKDRCLNTVTRRSNFDATGVFVNNALHWRTVEIRGGHTRIVAFDLVDEIFRCVPGLESWRFHIISYKLSVLDGCLSTITVNKEKGIHIWVMKEYGVKESWVNVSSFQTSVFSYYELVIPLAYSRGRDKVLIGGNSVRLYWYDLINKKLDYCDNKIHAISSSNVKTFTGSLVAFDDNHSGSDAENEEK